MLAYVEGYGCSLNQSDTEQLSGFLEKNGFALTSEAEKASLLIINTCAVKEQTEYKMLRRISKLHKVAEKSKAVLVVFGCLPKINSKAISSISKEIAQIGPSLEKLSQFLELPLQGFSPALEEKASSKTISIIPIARGCLGDCAYCATKNARGKLKSYGIEELDKKFRQGLSQGKKEFWLTAQDCGCYGFDFGYSLTHLIKTLLRNRGDFRIRVGMVNPAHLKNFLPEYLALFKDERLFRFFHLPVQSGSDKVLRAMNRGYSKRDFLEICSGIRARFPDASISTDVIVGFPGETEKDFGETVSLLKSIKPDVVNISRFGARPNTLAASMKGQLQGRVKKDRSRKLTELCRKLLLERNKGFVAEELLVLVDELGKKGGFIARSQGYKPVALKKAAMGSFEKVKVKKALPTYLQGTPF